MLRKRWVSTQRLIWYFQPAAFHLRASIKTLQSVCLSASNNVSLQWCHVSVDHDDSRLRSVCLWRLWVQIEEEVRGPRWGGFICSPFVWILKTPPRPELFQTTTSAAQRGRLEDALIDHFKCGYNRSHGCRWALRGSTEVWRFLLTLILFIGLCCCLALFRGRNVWKNLQNFEHSWEKKVVWQSVVHTLMKDTRCGWKLRRNLVRFVFLRFV